MPGFYKDLRIPSAEAVQEITERTAVSSESVALRNLMEPERHQSSLYIDLVRRVSRKVDSPRLMDKFVSFLLTAEAVKGQDNSHVEVIYDWILCHPGGTDKGPDWAST